MLTKLLLAKAPKPRFSVKKLLSQAETPSLVHFDYEIKKIDRAQRLVTGQIYAPDCLDSHGHFMQAKELQKVAHEFMLDGLQNQIDVQHDNETIDACLVESWIARGHPGWEEGAWVGTTKINDDERWQDVLDGKINGYSFEILTYKKDVKVQIEFSSWHYGFTDPDPHDNHSHAYLVKMAGDGSVLKGWTSAAEDGHKHEIRRSNVTKKSDGHSHRIHLED